MKFKMIFMVDKAFFRLPYFMFLRSDVNFEKIKISLMALANTFKIELRYKTVAFRYKN